MTMDNRRELADFLDSMKFEGKFSYLIPRIKTNLLDLSYKLTKEDKQNLLALVDIGIKAYSDIKGSHEIVMLTNLRKQLIA